MKLTYKEAYDKIIDAYFKDQILPFEYSFCLCGTLHGGNGWQSWETDDGQYSREQYKLIEKQLLDTICLQTTGLTWLQWNGYESSRVIKEHGNYEDALFNGMCAALDVLKQIHLDRGEIIDEPIKFKKRELQSL